MISHSAVTPRVAAAGAALGVTLVLAACGSSSSGSASKAASAKPAAAQSTGLTIGTRKGARGTYLVGASGRALYVWAADSRGRSRCSGGCAQNWPPLTASSTPKVTGGVNAADLSSITRSDGARQVTYKGHPLYYFIEDSGTGTTFGEGSNAFGARWWLMSPTGAELTSGGSSSGSSTSSSGTPGGSSYGGSSSGW